MPAAAVPDSKTVRLIHLSLLAGILLFLGVALVARKPLPGAADSPLPLIMLAAGIPLLLLSQLLRARIPARPASEPVDAWWATHYSRAMIVWSLVEAASLMGLVSFWITGNQLSLALPAVGLVLFVVTAPGRLAGE